MQNLRDKLLKAGLVSEQDARQAEERGKQKPSAKVSGRPPGKPERPPHREISRSGPPPSGAGTRPPTPARSAPIPRLPPLALPGSKAFQRLEALKQQEADKRLRELVYAAQVAISPGEHRFHFITRKGKLRRLEVSEAQAKQLENGTLAVVERPEPAMIEHSLVPAATAEEMMALSPKAVRFFNKEGAPVGFLDDEASTGEVSQETETRDSPPSEAEVAEEAETEATPEGDTPSV